MAEVIWRADQPPPSPHDLVATCRAGIERAGAVPPSCEVLGAHLMEADPAYVVFGSGVVSAVARCRERLAAAGVDSLGRYGGWQYSSIEAALLEGWGWAEQHGSARGGRSAGG
jgi:hypothetical protein